MSSLNTQYKDIDYKINTDLTNYSTIKIKVKADLYIVKSIESLKFLIKEFKAKKVKYTLLGLGANQILSEGSVYIKLKLPNIDNLNEYKEEYTLSASISLNQLSSAARKFNLDGWQVLTGIPATLGGAIAMNAGTRIGEIKDIVKSVTVLRKELSIESIVNFEGMFSYRNNNFLKKGDIVIAATLIHKGQRENVKEEILEYLNKRKVDQPWGTANCGCVFKNSNRISAGQAIDLLGLKGFCYKGLKISSVHANFIENTNASYEDFKELIEYINYQLETFYGQKFELEVKID